LVTVQVVAVPLHPPADQLATEKPGPGVAVTVTVSPTGTTHWGALSQPALESTSVIVSVPSGPAVVVTVAVGTAANLAASVSVAAALKVHGLVCPVQVPEAQAENSLPESGTAVIVSGSPASARHEETPVQFGTNAFASTMLTPPSFAEAVAVIVTVCAKLAESVTVEFRLVAVAA
jgi:hypothetical protein